MNRTMTCILCPNGCEMTIEYKEKELLSVCGNRCPKGASYAEQEIKNPMRNIASSVLVKGGDLPLFRADPPGKDPGSNGGDPAHHRFGSGFHRRRTGAQRPGTGQRCDRHQEYRKAPLIPSVPLETFLAPRHIIKKTGQEC